MTATNTDPLSRLKDELKGLERLARERLQGTRVGALLDTLPNVVERELDLVLNRVGLMRKTDKVDDAGTVVVVDAASNDVDVSEAVIGGLAADNEVDQLSKKSSRKVNKPQA